MNSNLKKFIPYSLIALGLYLLFLVGHAIPAGVCFFMGFVMILETIWPEKWESEK